MHSRLKSIESGNFFFQPRRLHLQAADLLVQLGDQGVLVLHLAALIVGEQLRRAVEQLPLPLPDLRRMHAELATASSLVVRSPRTAANAALAFKAASIRRRFAPMSFSQKLDQSYQGFDSKSWSSFLGPL